MRIFYYPCGLSQLYSRRLNFIDIFGSEIKFKFPLWRPPQAVKINYQAFLQLISFPLFLWALISTSSMMKKFFNFHSIAKPLSGNSKKKYFFFNNYVSVFVWSLFIKSGASNNCVVDLTQIAYPIVINVQIKILATIVRHYTVVADRVQKYAIYRFFV